MGKKELLIGVIISFIAAMSGTYYVSQDEDAYHCKSKEIVMLCEKLSSGLGTRCYFEDTYKICKDGWEKVEINTILNIKENNLNRLSDWKCHAPPINKCEEVN